MVEHECGGGVSEGVAVAFGEACLAEVFRDDAADLCGADGGGVAGDEQCVFGGVAIDVQGSCFGEVVGDPLSCSFADGDESVLCAFALVDEELALFEVDVVAGDVGEFGASDAGGVEDLEHGSVASSERGVEVGECEYGFCLSGGEVVAWEVVGWS